MIRTLRGGRTKQPARTVLTVDLYGECADHDPITDVADHYDVPVLKNAAQALGAAYSGHPAGTLSDVGIYSFGSEQSSEQIVTTCGGGMLVTPDAGLAHRARQVLIPPVLHVELSRRDAAT